MITVGVLFWERIELPVNTDANFTQCNLAIQSKGLVTCLWCNTCLVVWLLVYFYVGYEVDPRIAFVVPFLVS